MIFVTELKTLTSAILALLLVGCGDDGPDLPSTPDPTAAESPAPTPFPDPPTNPLCEGAERFNDGNLWKPAGDHTGALVVLIRAEYEKAFLSCSATRKGGGAEDLQFTGFSNGDRQTWRGALPGSGYENSGVVTCEGVDQTCLFRFRGKASKRHD